VGVFSSNFTNVEIRGFANTITGFMPTEPCNTSCADGPSKRVQLDANAAFMPMSRVMREMGHVADYVEKNYKGVNDYCYPSHGGCGWSFNSAEWGSGAFEEAIATLGSNATFWWPDATTPTSCIDAGICYDGSGNPKANTNIEASSYPWDVDNCVANEGRWMLSHQRFHWDVYDANNDAAGDTLQDGLDCFWCVFTNLASYASGINANQINEPWQETSLTNVDNYDGRGSASWR
jgi:hypothetical protein